MDPLVSGPYTGWLISWYHPSGFWQPCSFNKTWHIPNLKNTQNYKFNTHILNKHCILQDQMAGIGKFLNFKIVSLETSCSSYKIIWETCDYLRNLWSLKNYKLNLPLSFLQFDIRWEKKIWVTSPSYQRCFWYKWSLSYPITMHFFCISIPMYFLSRLLNFLQTLLSAQK